ncbi:MAG: glycosyltransferase family 39 protein [Phycisphaerae bacterium]
MSSVRRAFSPAAVPAALGGIALLALALTDAATIEALLRGRATGELRWGPDLFRALCAFHGVALLGLGIALRRTSDPDMRDARRTPRAALPTAPALDNLQHAWWIVGALMLVGLALRLYKLNSCLWFDELLTLVDFVRHPWGLAVSEFPNQNQHMFYTVLAKACFAIFGESFAALRLPSVVFGVWSIPALYLLGRRTIGSRDALLACGLMTLSYHHVWFSQNARGYMILLCLTIANTWIWLAALQRGSARLWAGYALTAALGIWGHMTMVFVLAAHGLVWALLLIAPPLRKIPATDAGFWWKCPLAWLFGATLTLQLHAVALPEFFGSALHEVSQPSEWTDPWWVVREAWSAFAQKGPAGLLLLAGGMATVGVGVIGIWRRDWRAALAMLLPGIIGGAAMLSTGHNLWPRFFFFCMGYGVLFAIHGAARLPEWLVWPFTIRESAEASASGRHDEPIRTGPRPMVPIIGVALALLLIGASAATLPRNYALPRQDFSGARDFVERERSPDDGVISVGLAGVAYNRYFAPPARYPNWEIAQSGDELMRARRGFARTWLIYTIPTEVKAYRPGVWEQVERDYENVRLFPGTLGDGTVFVCREKSRNPGAFSAPSATSTDSVIQAVDRDSKERD